MKLDAIGIVAADLATSVAFYRTLGLDFTGEPGADHLEARTDGGMRVMLDAEEMIRGIYPGWTRQVGNQLSFAFDCGSPGAVDQAYAAIVAAGHRSKTAPFDAFWGQRYAVVFDPDGNQIDLFATQPAP